MQNPVVIITSAGGVLTAACPTANACQWYNTSPVLAFIPNSISKTNLNAAGFDLFPNPGKGLVTLKATGGNGEKKYPSTSTMYWVSK